jgi:hypothetical protein
MRRRLRPKPWHHCPLATAICPERPASVRIMATHARGHETIVLYLVERASAWLDAHEPPDEDTKSPSAQETLHKLVRRCDERIECVEAELKDDHVAYAAFDVEVWDWEIAAVTNAPPSVRARHRIWGPTLAPESEASLELEVDDMDGDARPEAMAVVPVTDPYEQHFFERDIGGDIGIVVDLSDLHRQFATTRAYRADWADVTGTRQTAQTVWLAKDVDGDRHPDLKLRQKTDETCDPCFHDDPDEKIEPEGKKSASALCPWDAATDTWICPSPQLGAQLLREPVAAER